MKLNIYKVKWWEEIIIDKYNIELKKIELILNCT